MKQDHILQKVKNELHRFQAINANIRFNYPHRKLKIIGVTGTDGKTTTTLLIHHILKENGLKCGYISTINAQVGDKKLETGLHVTTPDPWMVPKYLNQMIKEGVDYVILESTSMGLQQHRLWGIKFEASTITNIKEDHLDYHGTWQNYASAKFEIIRKLKFRGLAVLNKDDYKGRTYIESKISLLKNEPQIIWYSKNDILDLQSNLDKGFTFKYQNQEFNLPMIGEYNLENALAAINICSNYLSLPKIAKALKTFPTPLGRMQVIITKPFTVVIDFAHTPHALEVALKAVNQFKNKKNNLITVFGCAGKRDKQRRLMGEVSQNLSDITILTAEDPRDEKLKGINSEILAHTNSNKLEVIKRFENNQNFLQEDLKELGKLTEKSLLANKTPFFTFDEDSINSRIDAIKLALNLAKPNDIVFITGKAHEQSLAFGKKEQEIPWNEQEQTQRLFDELILNQPKQKSTKSGNNKKRSKSKK